MTAAVPQKYPQIANQLAAVQSAMETQRAQAVNQSDNGLSGQYGSASGVLIGGGSQIIPGEITIYPGSVGPIDSQKWDVGTSIQWPEPVNQEPSDLAKEVMDLLREKNAEMSAQAEWLRDQIDELRAALKTKDRLIETLVDQIYGTKKDRQGSNRHSSGEESGDESATPGAREETVRARERASEVAEGGLSS